MCRCWNCLILQFILRFIFYGVYEPIIWVGSYVEKEMSETGKRALLFLIVALISTVLLSNFDPMVTVIFVFIIFTINTIYRIRNIR